MRFACVTDDAWLAFVERTVETLDIGPGTRVFEVECGDGAFLLPLAENGYIVGGLDPSADVIRSLSQAVPAGRFLVGEASALDPAEPWDVVLACGTFQAFPDLDYARGVLARMAAKATHAIAILDLPERIYDRGWMMRALAEIDVKAIQIEQLNVDGYADAPSRFNVFARL